MMHAGSNLSLKSHLRLLGRLYMLVCDSQSVGPRGQRNIEMRPAAGAKACRQATLETPNSFPNSYFGKYEPCKISSHSYCLLVNSIHTKMLSLGKDKEIQGNIRLEHL